MSARLFSNRWWLASALLVAFCSRGTAPSLPTPITLGAARESADGIVGAAALGDLKIGSGAIEIVRLRMDRQAGGASVLRQYADPARTYAMNPGETIELWAEYPPEVPNPRFKVIWGDGTDDFTGCGACLLRHSYREGGVFIVQASLDDRVSSAVTRTFVLDSRPIPTPTPTGTPLPTATATPGSQTFSYSGALQTFSVPAGVTSVVIEAWGAQGGEDTNGRPGGLGAFVMGTFTVAASDVLNVVVGGKGQDDDAAGGGGGSGISFGGSALAVAGGGGGRAVGDAACSGRNAVTTTSGQPGNNPFVSGTSGAGGSAGGDGGDGVLTGFSGRGGRGFNSGSTGSSGAAGGGCASTSGVFGLGGGGGGCSNSGSAGGGGGFSGGGAGGGGGCGGGGGSFNGGTSQTNTAAVQSGNGQVRITW